MPTNEEITHHPENDPTVRPWVNGGPRHHPIEIVPYQPDWPRRYGQLAIQIKEKLGTVALDVDHVGSTSVPGLAAKDVIDIDLTVADPCDEDAYVPALTELGFEHVIREPSFHEHRCLMLEGRIRANLHVWGPDCPEHIRHVMFRDWLRANADDRERYAEAKRAAVPGTGDMRNYNVRKQDVLRAIYDRMFQAAGLL